MNKKCAGNKPSANSRYYDLLLTNHNNQYNQQHNNKPRIPAHRANQRVLHFNKITQTPINRIQFLLNFRNRPLDAARNLIKFVYYVFVLFLCHTMTPIIFHLFLL